MNMYLLLRDNKQTGPYSADELRSKGIKPYDLVWVEGKSAAWRYPGEVEELKSFSPVVEEQPFDRFFKKPSQTTQTNVSVSTSSANGAASAVNTPAETLVNTLAEGMTTAPVSFRQPDGGQVSATPDTPNRRIIYVTMPVSKTGTPPATPVSQSSVIVTTPVVRASTPLQEELPAKKIAAVLPAAVGLGMDELLPDEEIFHQETIKGYKPVEKRPHSISRVGSITKPLAIAAGVIVLLASGIFIGLSLNGNFRGFGHSVALKEETTPDHLPDHPARIPVYTTAATNPGTTGNTRETIAGNVISDPVHAQDNTKATNEEIARKKALAREKAAALKNAAGSSAALPAKDSAATIIGAQSASRETSHQTDDPAMDKDAVKNNIANLVSVSSNKYSTGTFGGINDLQVTVSNRSVYPLDLVVVEVQYVQSNKKVFKTENLSFRGIGAGSALMEEAPKSSRGIKVQYKIILINSKELGLSYSGI